MTTVYFAGSEDIDFQFLGPVTAVTDTSNSRGTYVRGCLKMGGGNSSEIRSVPPFTASTFWMSAREGNGFPAGNVSGASVWRMIDSSGVIRLQMEYTSSGTTAAWKVVKIDGSGTKTTLFSGSAPSGGWPPPTSPPNETIKFDVFVNYAVAGQLTLYLTAGGVNTVLGTFTGDVTTNSVTSLAQVGFCDNGGGNNVRWSEVMVCDVDTRTFSLQTFIPVANGNTHTFDTGTPAAANVNELVVNDATLDGSTTANQIDQYTQGAVATGTYSVVAVGITARMQKGATGPSKADFVVRTGAADFLSTDQVLTTVWSQYSNWWSQNPNTSADWTTGQIGSTAGFNIGLKSIT